MVWVANTDEGFGDYLMYRAYLPILWSAPKACKPGLQPVLHRIRRHEIQNGLPKLAKRKPVERDYTAWLGGRALTDGIMRSGKTTRPK